MHLHTLLHNYLNIPLGKSRFLGTPNSDPAVIKGGGRLRFQVGLSYVKTETIMSIIKAENFEVERLIESVGIVC